MERAPSNFDRKTLVQITEDASFVRGHVLVSTTGGHNGGYETLVVPWVMGEFLWNVELLQVCDNRAKQARKTHREVCKSFDYLERDFVFVEDQYVPMTTLEIVREALKDYSIEDDC